MRLSVISACATAGGGVEGEGGVVTEPEFIRVFSLGLGVGFLLGVVAAGYVALGFRERRGEEFAAPRLRGTDNTIRRLYGAWRRKRRLT